MITRLFQFSLAAFAVIGFLFAGRTVFAATITWDGGGADNNWFTDANWSGDRAPGGGEDVVFDGTSAKNSVMNIAGLTLQSFNASSTYTGTLSIANGNTLSVTGNWTYGAANFDAGTSTLKFTSNVSAIFTPGSVNYYNLEIAFSESATIAFTVSGTATTTNDLVISQGLNGSGINTGTINVGGNVSVSDADFGTNASSFHTATINLNGSGNQTISSNGGALPNVAVNKSSGTLFLQGTIPVDRNWTYTAGTLDAGTSTLKFLNRSAITFTPGSVNYYNIEIAANSSVTNSDITISGTATTTNNLVISDGDASSDIKTGTINVGGSVTITDSDYGTSNIGTATINLNGSGNQTIFSSNGGALPNITINKASGTLLLNGSVIVGGNWTYTAGTLDAGTSTLKFLNRSAITFTPGSVNYYNIDISSQGCCTNADITISGTATTTNDLIINGGDGSHDMKSGTVNVGGAVNVTSSNYDSSSAGTATINLNGSGSQTVSSSGGFLPNVTVNKSSGIASVDSNVTITGTLGVTSGELRHNAYTLQINGAATISSGGTLSDYATASSTIKFGSTITNNGALVLDGGGTGCGNFDYVLLRSTTDGTQRSWSGTGTFSVQDADIKDQGGALNIAVRSGTNSGNNAAQGWSFNSNCLPSASFDNDFSSWSSGNITANYKLIDPNSDTNNISQMANSGIEYSADGTTWSDATQGTGGDGMTGLSSSASPGTSHSFVWNSSTDLSGVEDSTVYLRVRPNDGSENASAWATSSAFAVDNLAPSSVGAPTLSGLTSSSVTINKPTTVTESGSGLYQWQARRGGATALGLNATTTGSVTDSSRTSNTQYSYDAQFTDYQNNASSYGTAASAYTLAPTPTNLSASSVARTSMTLAVDSLTNDTIGSSGYYFVNTTASTTSGWIQTNSWADSGLTCNVSYSYTVRYRNSDGTPTSEISLTQATSACPSETAARTSYAISPPRIYDAPKTEKTFPISAPVVSRDETEQIAKLRTQIRLLQTRLLELYRLLIQALLEQVKTKKGGLQT